MSKGVIESQPRGVQVRTPCFSKSLLSENWAAGGHLSLLSKQLPEYSPLCSRHPISSSVHCPHSTKKPILLKLAMLRPVCQAQWVLFSLSFDCLLDLTVTHPHMINVFPSLSQCATVINPSESLTNNFSFLGNPPTTQLNPNNHVCKLTCLHLPTTVDQPPERTSPGKANH